MTDAGLKSAIIKETEMLSKDYSHVRYTNSKWRHIIKTAE